MQKPTLKLVNKPPKTAPVKSWEDQRDWLQNNFGAVRTEWLDPNNYVTSIDGLCLIKNGVSEVALQGRGRTGIASIRAFFNEVVTVTAPRPGYDRYYLCLDIAGEKSYITVNPASLELSYYRLSGMQLKPAP